MPDEVRNPSTLPEWESEINLKVILKAIQSWVLIVDQDLVVKKVYNEELLFVGYNQDLLLGRSLFDTMPVHLGPKLRMIKSDLEAGVARSSITYDWNFSHRKFKQRLHIIRVSESIFFVYNEDLTLEQRALEEKSALLKELVHRVKNNFQTLDSLVALHSTRLADPEVKMHFSALRNRIFSLGAVHDHLYRTNDFSKIELNSYLGQVARNLINSHPTSKGLVLSGEVEFIVDSESASKCGAILNELLTNTFKYAFPSQRANIACYWTGKLPNSISFNYFDNGPFYQTRVHTHQGKGLGQLIINSFTESLNGHIEYQDLLKNSHEWPKALSEERSFGKKQQIFYFSLVFPERSE